MNRFYRLFLFLLAGCWASGCDSPGRRPAHRHGQADSAAANSADLRPELFTAAPENVEGCVGLYTYDSLNIPFDSLDVDNGKKVLATKTESFAFIRLRGRNLILRYDAAQSAKLGDKGFREVYRGNDYTVVLVMHTMQEEGEAVQESGTMEVLHGDKHFKIKVKGIAGC